MRYLNGSGQLINNNQMSSQTSKQLSQSKIMDDECASKKKKLRPRPDDDEPKSASNSKKLKTSTTSLSKSKFSTQKKGEVTFSEDVEEINKDDLEGKENKDSMQLTPLKATSPSKQSLKSVKEHVKTPFSKIKDNQDSGSAVSSQSKTSQNQPNFDGEIINKSAKKSSRNVTPTKSQMRSNSKLRSKSPLNKIREEKTECETKKDVKEKTEAKEEESPIEQVVLPSVEEKTVTEEKPKEETKEEKEVPIPEEAKEVTIIPPKEEEPKTELPPQEKEPNQDQ